MTQLAEKLTYQDLKREAGKPVAKLFSDGQLKAFAVADAETGIEKPMLRFVVSADTTDLVNDVMTETAIDKMLAQAKGKIFFLNHRYEIPQDVLGLIAETYKEYTDLTDPITGEVGPHVQLVFEIAVATTNPAAMKTYELVKVDGIKIGASVSIIILENHPATNGTNQITDLYFLEASGVGIPANQNSWAKSIEKALREYEREQRKQTPAPVVDKAATKPAAPKKDKKMTKKAKRLVRKNAFDEIMSGHANATIDDLTQALASAIGNILGNADGGNTDGVKEALDSLFSDFEEACMTAIQPAVDAMEQETPEDEADEDSDGTPDDQEAGAGADEEDEDSEDKSLALRRVRAFLKAATPRRARKDDTPDVPPPDGDGDNSGLLQDMHDYCVSKGAVCKDGMDLPTAGDDGVSYGYKGKASAKELKDAKVRIKELETENAQWEAIAVEMRAKLEEYLKQPLAPGAGK